VAAFYSMGRCEEALEAARSLPFQTRRTRLYGAACRMAMGDEAAARQHVAEALAENPGLALDFVEANENFADPKTLQTLLDRLRRAGLPDPPEGVKANLPRPIRTAG